MHINPSDELPRGASFIHFPPAMAYPDTICIRRSPLPDFGLLSHMLFFGYLGQTFGALAAKQHICHNVLCYLEDREDTVVTQGLLQPDYSCHGLPYTFSVPHELYPYLRCNGVATDHSRRIILDCEIAENTTRVIPQSLFAPYAGLPRSQAELQSASLLPPIFFFRLDHSVGLPLETAKFAESQTPLLLYDNWCPMEGKASIKLRIAVRCLLIIQNRHFSHLGSASCSGMAIRHGRPRSSFEIAEKNRSHSHDWYNSWQAVWIDFYRYVRLIPLKFCDRLNSRFSKRTDLS